MFHRHSFFPLIVIVLSLALAGLVYWSTQDEASSPSILVQEVEPVDADSYRDGLSQVVKAFEERMAAAGDDVQRLRAVQTALSGVLALRVPTEFKNLHLALAVAFSEMENTLESGGHDLTQPTANIFELKQAYPWLAQ